MLKLSLLFTAAMASGSCVHMAPADVWVDMYYTVLGPDALLWQNQSDDECIQAVGSPETMKSLSSIAISGRARFLVERLAIVPASTQIAPGSIQHHYQLVHGIPIEPQCKSSTIYWIRDFQIESPSEL